MARLRTPVPSALFLLPAIPVATRRVSSRRVCISPRRPPRATAEEELFIRRNAAKSVPASGAPNPPPAPSAPVPSPAADAPEADVTFDYGNAPSPPISQAPSSAPGPAPAPAPTPPPAASEQTAARRRIGLPSGWHGFATRARRDGLQLLSESGALSRVRLPTQQETFLFTWEVSLIVAVLLLLRAGVASTLRWIHNRLNATRGLKSNIPYEASVFECMQRPLEFLSLFTVGTSLADAVSRPLAASGLVRHIRTLRELGIIIAATWFLLRWIDRIRSRFAVDKRIDKAQVDATSRIATVVTFLASLLISLDTIGINVQTVLAFGGIGGVAIGFAGREIISNFFGGFMIYITRPFSVGEWIRSIEEAELNGTVEDIGWYHTRVRTWDKRPLYIPNSRFSTLIVENGSRMDNRRILHTLHLRHEDMPVVPTIVAAMEQLLMTHQELDPRQHRLAYVDSFGDYSVKIWLSCYTKSVFLYDYRRVQQDVLIKCHNIIRANGAKLATVNTRDVRPGADTDRYGPFGSNATFGQATPGVQPPERSPAVAPVNTDVPSSPSYGRPNSAVRFNTIESGVDLSRISTPAVTSAGPNTNDIREPSPAAAAGNTVDPLNAGSNVEIASQRSASVAAVAAAAAALHAGLKNVSTRSQDNETSKIQSQGQGDGTESSLTPVEGQGTGVSGSASSGQMKITAAKPARTVSSNTAQVASPTTPAGATTAKAGLGKPAEDASTTNTANQSSPLKADDTPSTPSLATNSTAPTPITGEMKITRGRKQASITQILADPARQDVKDSERSISKEPPAGRSDAVASPAAATDLQTSPVPAGQQMKISAGKSTGSVNKAAKIGSASAKSSGRGTGIDGIGKDNVVRPASVQGGQGQSEVVAAGQKPTSNRQSSSSPQGGMKISKARKPFTVSQMSSEADGKNGSQVSGTNGTKSDPSPTSASSAEDGGRQP